MGSAVAAANDLVAQLRPDLVTGIPPAGEDWLTLEGGDNRYSKRGHDHELMFGLVTPDGEPSVDPQPTAEAVWPPRAEQAALVQAARLYGRRGSVQGVAAFTDLGITTLPRLDPDVRALLELGEYQPSVVA